MTYHSEKHTAPSPQLMRVVTHPRRDHFVSFTTAAPTGANAQGWGTHAVSSYQIADVLKHSSELWFQTHKSHVIEEFRQVKHLSKLLDHVM